MQFNTTIPFSIADILGAGHRRSRLSLLQLLASQFQLQFQHGLCQGQDVHEGQSLQSGSPSSIPDDYIADMIAKGLLPYGADLYHNKATANCILSVNDKRYYVHVQMLASRSPTLRFIFDEMIQQDAWNVDAGHDDDNDNDEENDNEDDINIREDSDAITGNGYPLRSHTENIDITQDSMDGEVHSWGHEQESMGYVFQLDEDLCESGMLVDTAAREVTTTMAVENWRNSIHSSSRLDEDLGNYDLQDNGHAMGPDHEEYTMSTSQGSGQSSDSDEEEQLPVLTLQVADPEGSRFDELLYWLYTNDSARWRACFTPQNYDSILQNIRILNIFKDDVFKICQDFELSTSPELGLRGKAHQLWFPPPPPHPEMTVPK
ncbi:MAG: hypothetical protein J3Q66DRAFT_322582 [Benniella sp.]|nr:MAG: hypothetical protein J3Q66DRAFT_322582 [Benniella sp.]